MGVMHWMNEWLHTHCLCKVARLSLYTDATQFPVQYLLKFNLNLAIIFLVSYGGILKYPQLDYRPLTFNFLGGQETNCED